MRSFAVLWSQQATLQAVRARAFLGTARAAELDDEIEHVTSQLSRFPESAPPVQKRRRQWSFAIRKKTLTRNPYALFYRLDIEGERIVILGLRHQRSRPPRPDELCQ